MSLKKVKEVMLFPNGTSAVFDKDGNQMSSLQVSWFMLFLKHLEANGVDPADKNINYHLPGTISARVFKAENDYGYNWEIK